MSGVFTGEIIHIIGLAVGKKIYEGRFLMEFIIHMEKG